MFVKLFKLVTITAWHCLYCQKPDHWWKQVHIIKFRCSLTYKLLCTVYWTDRLLTVKYRQLTFRSDCRRQTWHCVMTLSGWEVAWCLPTIDWPRNTAFICTIWMACCIGRIHELESSRLVCGLGHYQCHAKLHEMSPLSFVTPLCWMYDTPIL